MSSELICTGKQVRDIGKSEIYFDGYFCVDFEECIGGMSMSRNDCLMFINGVLDEGLPKLKIEDMDSDLLCEYIIEFVAKVCEESVGPQTDEEGNFAIEDENWGFWKHVWWWRTNRNNDMEHGHTDELIIENISAFGRDGLRGGKSVESDEVTEAVWRGDEYYESFNFGFLDIVEAEEVK